ncbi:hypothetical protein [Nocardia carnea]|uniref:hypothetical protein n=1 Tax=Nocardia carnea TaxID=37328 RepID=UPI0002D3AC3F|nr:hypothetical protein [Nocardia carnea]
MTDDSALIPPSTESALTAEDIHRQVVDLLGRAARLRRPARPLVAAGATPAPGGESGTEPIDFAAFAVSVLAEVAANRGGIAALRGTGSGSWKSDRVEELLISAGCDQPDLLAGYRSAPIVIDVHIDHLLDAGEVVEEPGTRRLYRWPPPLAEGEDYEGQQIALDEAQGEAAQALVARHAGRPYAEWEHEEAAQQRIFDAEQEALLHRWATRYTCYLDAFRATVDVRVAELGLTVPVEVRGNSGPEARTDPAAAVYDRWDADPLAAEIYLYAVRNTPISLLTTDTPEATR